MECRDPRSLDVSRVAHLLQSALKPETELRSADAAVVFSLSSKDLNNESAVLASQIARIHSKQLCAKQSKDTPIGNHCQCIVVHALLGGCRSNCVDKDDQHSNHGSSIDVGGTTKACTVSLLE